jgi:hypothetical protein
MNIPKIMSNERSLKALTGLSRLEFESLTTVFEPVLNEILRNNSKATVRKFGGGAKGKLTGIQSKLFFILLYEKTYPTFDFIASIIDFDKSRAVRNTHLLLAVLEKALGRSKSLPKRRINNMEDFLKSFPEAKDLFVDAVERPVQRPASQNKQRKLYSGKKKTHTKKTVVIMDENRKILLATPTKSGRRHDKRVADKNLIFEHIPIGVTIWADTGFQGLLKQHANTMMPTKASKGKPLTYEQKQENKTISGIRIIVEHAIGGMKRFKAFADIFRNKKAFMEDQVMNIAAGLWNFHLEHTA